MTSELTMMLNDTSTRKVSTTKSYASNSQGINNETFDEMLPFNQTDVAVFTTFIVIFMVFGLFANLLTIIVISTSRKLKSIFHFFIFSLCVSDVTSALISWINLYRRTWGFDIFGLPYFICKFYWAVDLWTSYSTALHILSFAILRSVMFRWPDRVNSTKSGYPVGLVWIFLIWIITFVCGAVPYGLMFGDSPKNRSSNEPDAKWPSCTLLPQWIGDYPRYTKSVFPIFFYLPILVTILLSIAIVCLMLKKNKKMKAHISKSAAKRRNVKERQAVFQLALIVTSFIIGYVPFTAYQFFSVQQRNDTYEKWWIDWHFGTAQYMCLRLSECLNPIFYHIGSKTLREETKKLFYKLCHCLPSNQYISKPTSNTTTKVSATVSV